MKIQKHTINVSPAELSDLSTRLRQTRFPDSGPTPHATGNGKDEWAAGTPLSFIEKLHSYWVNEYDWKKHEKILNGFDNFTCELDKEFDSLKLHFIHAMADKSIPKKKLPILLLHGWPGSVWEFNKMIPILTKGGFDVVAPSLPGYGFSEAPKSKGWNPERIAQAIDSLMKSLGYKQYFAQGGDWGSQICKYLGSNHTDSCVAIHVNMVSARPPNGERISQALKRLGEEDLKKLQRVAFMSKYEFAYQEIQGTKPQTLGYGLSDSPIGLAAWIIEKFSTWGDTRPNGDPLRAFSMDDLLTNVCIYWFNNAITSSCRLYYESRTLHNGGELAGFSPNVTVPTAVAEFPEEIYTPPESWVRAAYKIERWTKFDKGGHFAALEQPELLGKDVVEYFSSLLRSKL